MIVNVQLNQEGYIRRSCSVIINMEHIGRITTNCHVQYLRSFSVWRSRRTVWGCNIWKLCAQFININIKLKDHTKNNYFTSTYQLFRQSKISICIKIRISTHQQESCWTIINTLQEWFVILPRKFVLCTFTVNWGSCLHLCAKKWEGIHLNLLAYHLLDIFILPLTLLLLLFQVLKSFSINFEEIQLLSFI